MPSAGSAEFRHPVSMNVICHPPVPRVSQIIMHGVHIHIFLCYKFPSGASQTFVPSNVTVSPLPIKPGSVPCMISGIYRLTNQSRIPAEKQHARKRLMLSPPPGGDTGRTINHERKHNAECTDLSSRPRPAAGAGLAGRD